MVKKTKQGDIQLVLEEQTLQLMPERCIFWVEREILFTADLHLGKEATFRSKGIALPDGPSSEALERLSLALQRSGAKRLIILGDFFHGDNSVQTMLDEISTWRKHHHNLAMDTILGSHDRWSGAFPPSLDMNVHDQPLPIDPFLLSHYPSTDDKLYCLAGHLHPGVFIHSTKRSDSLRLPCFHFTRHVGILPAFSKFTGITRINLKGSDKCFAIAENRVVEVPH